MPPLPTPQQLYEQDTKKAQDAAVKKKYDDEVLRLRKQYMMQQIFPTM
jgi:hypothetical protein